MVHDFYFNIYFFHFILLPAFCSLLLDWIENEKNQDGHGHVMPFSPVMRPSQMLPNQSKNSNSFIDAFMQHLKANERKIDTTPPASFANERIEKRLPMDVKQSKEPKPSKERKPRKPREPSSVKKPQRKKEESNCTTIGLQIQIRDPNTEPEPPPPSCDFESNKISYPFQSDDRLDTISTSNLISTVAENYLPVVSSESELGTASHTYYNMDSTENEPGEQYLYEPEPVYHVQPMGVLSNECGNRSAPIVQSPDINAAPLNPYNVYPDQKGTGHHPLISHFNVSHTNVNNSSVHCDPLHNWRAGNEIM